jgi:hypothetical protein
MADVTVFKKIARNSVFGKNSIYRILNSVKTVRSIYFFEYASQSKALHLQDSVMFSVVNYVGGTGNRR